MNAAEMTAQAAKFHEWAREKRRNRGTGYHDKDDGKGGGPVSPQNSGDAPIDEHCVCFRDRFDMHFAGPCATKAQAALKTYAAANGPLLTTAIDGHARTLIETAAEYAALPLRDNCLTIRQQQFNAIVEVLKSAGVGVTVTGVGVEIPKD